MIDRRGAWISRRGFPLLRLGGGAIIDEVMRSLPTGTVTLLFADIEASTRLLRELGPERYAAALATYRGIVREASAAWGVEVDIEGDGIFVAFPSARRAVDAASDTQARLAEAGFRVRMGLHTGEPIVVSEEYAGMDVHRASRIAAAGHGGQTLLSQSTYALVGRSSDLVDLGVHRLKDLGEPVRLYQLGEARFPPLRSLNRVNLPIQPTPLIGRERELGDARRLLQAHRLVTLTGSGGSGKTRLALQLAAESAEDFPDGIWWVPLQALHDPEMVVPAISHALGAGDLPIESAAEAHLLLVLDNFEQVLTAASRVGEPLSQVPGAKLLITSREPLHLAAEYEYAVYPLREDEAVHLFTERARALRPDFSDDDRVVPEICTRLDCLPLALELAAARTKALSTRQLLQRLEKRLPMLTGGPRDAPERQRTLRATIAWSYDLPTTDERRTFARLAVFVGGSTLEAAEAVCETSLDTIAALVDKSLLRREGERYSMLETISEYAGECLDESGELEQVRRRHAEYYLDKARSVERLIRSPQAAAFLDRLEADHGNMRAALTWLSSAEHDKPLRLAVWGLAARLHGFGDSALDRRDLVEASRLYRESLEIGRQLEDDLQAAYCLAGLAAVGASRGSRCLAARLWGGVNAFERTSGIRLHDPERSRYERLLHGLEQASETSADYAAGLAMTLDQAVEYAVAHTG